MITTVNVTEQAVLAFMHAPATCVHKIVGGADIRAITLLNKGKVRITDKSCK